MRYKLFAPFAVVGFVILLSACGPSDSQIATAVAQTESAKPTNTATPAPTPTHTPEPTRTPTPTIEPTPTIAFADVILGTYSNIEVVFRDTFEQTLSGFSPSGWQADGKRPYVRNNAKIEIAGSTVAYFEKETLTLNEAVILRFQFAPKSNFTMGIDGVRQGQRIPASQPGFRSITMEFRNSPLAYYNTDQNRYFSRFEGNLKLAPDVWYMYTLGFAGGKNFIIKIWDPENPSMMLTHKRQAEDMTNVNIFIMWLDEGARVYIDEFTIIKFSELK
jgi:hypothetical protein